MDDNRNCTIASTRTLIIVRMMNNDNSRLAVSVKVTALPAAKEDSYDGSRV